MADIGISVLTLSLRLIAGCSYNLPAHPLLR